MRERVKDPWALRLIDRVLGAFGLGTYEIQGVQRPDFAEIPQTIGNRYTPRPPYPWDSYSPWFDAPFLRKYDSVRGISVVPEDRCYYAYLFAQHCLNLERGDLAECGVFRGGTAYLIASAISEAKIRRQLHLFDTFCGMPSQQIGEHDCHKPGEFANTSLEEVKRFLTTYPFVEYHPGIIPDTLAEVEKSRFSFVHLDVDLYKTNRACCQFFYQRMVKGGVFLFDEYGFEEYELSERLAVDEFFRHKPEHPIVLASGQCFVIKA